MDDEKIVELIDEDGEKARFGHLMTLEYMGNHYLVLHPCDGSVGEDEVVIMRMRAGDGDGEIYEPVADDEMAEKVFLEFMSILEMEEE